MSNLAVVALARVIDRADMENIIASWKLSNAEADQLRWTMGVREAWGFEMPLGVLKQQIAAGTQKDWGLDYLRIAERYLDLEDLREWAVPVFPITGQDLIDRGVVPGPEMGRILTRMKEDWVRDQMKTNYAFYLANVEEFRD